MTAPHPETHPFTPEHDLLRKPGEVPAVGEPRTPEQQQEELNQAADALNRIISAETEIARLAVGQSTAYAGLERLYGSGGTFIQGVRANRDSGRHHEHAEIHDRYKTAESKEELRELLAKGNTGSIVQLLDDLSGKSDVSHKASVEAHDSIVGKYADLTNKTAEAGHEAAEARSTWEPNPHRKLTDKDIPHYYAPREAQDNYKTLKAAHAGAEKKEKERVAKLAIPHAKLDLARRNEESALKAAGERVFVSEAIRDRVTTLFGPEREAYKENLEMLSALQDTVMNELSTWSLGEKPHDKDQQARIATLMDEWAQQISGMSRHDQNRQESLHNWVVLTTRFEQRRAMRMPESSSRKLPMFSPDRGVCVETTDGLVTLHDDGTITHFEDGDEIRQWSDGSPYIDLFYEAPETTFSDEYLASLSDDDLLQIRNNTVQSWEASRDLQSEVNAAVAAGAYTNRLTEHSELLVDQYNTTTNTITNLEERLQSAKDDRDASIENVFNEKMRENPDRDKAQARLEAITRVSNDIVRIETEITEAQSVAVKLMDELRDTRTNINASRYIRDFFGVTRHDEAGLEEDSKAWTNSRGHVVLENGTLNDIKAEGTWVIYPDGSSTLHTDSESINYKPNGEIA